jgi:signal transduction histidine kinase
VSLVDGDLLELVTVQTCCLPAGYAAAHTAVWDAGTREETRRALDLRAPVVIPSLADELARDARYAPLVEVLSEVGAGALVVIPLVAADRLLGIVHGYYARPGEVHPDELAFLRAIADHGAVAVEHARLVDEAARSTLLEERQRLSRELHDSVSQAVYGIALGARTARTLLDRDPSRVAEPLDYVLELAEAGLAEMRALIFALRPESLEREGLVVALEQQAESVRARHRLAVETDLGTEPDLPLAAKEALYRVAQEALHNIVKHARATHVRLALAATAGDVVLVVADDGAGFDAGAAFPGHLGLRTMRERAEAGGGALVLDSAPGGGTTVTLTLPRHAGSGAAA